jgi:hypothetical protein
MRISRWTLAAVCVWSLASQAGAAAAKHAQFCTRDASYEEYLRVRANPDEKITPARVLRWMAGLRGQAITKPSSTEFQPVVDADKHRVQVIAAFTYKFF